MRLHARLLNDNGYTALRAAWLGRSVLAGTRSEVSIIPGFPVAETRSGTSNVPRSLLGDGQHFGDAPMIGVSTASESAKGDTLGLFVQSVVRDGPAEKAEVVEGDRIAAINGVSLRAAREDAEDGSVGARDHGEGE